MGLDITIKRTRPTRCPDCGKVVSSETLGYAWSGGADWYDYLESVGYYDPTEDYGYCTTWYAEDMTLTADQAKGMADFSRNHKCVGYTEIEKLVALALFHNDSVVINADW